MSGLDSLDILFLAWGLFFQIVRIVHFILRKRAFEACVMRCGRIVYVLAVPAVAISAAILSGGKAWSFWLGARSTSRVQRTCVWSNTSSTCSGDFLAPTCFSTLQL